MYPDRQRIGPSALTTEGIQKTDWLSISAAEAGKKLLVCGSVVVWMKSHITSNVEEKQFVRSRSTKNRAATDLVDYLCIVNQPCRPRKMYNFHRRTCFFVIPGSYRAPIIGLFAQTFTTKRQHRANIAPTEVRMGRNVVSNPKE